MAQRKSISKSLRFQIFARDGFSCRYCGRQSDEVTLVIDHVIPVCQDGTNEPENLVTSCSDCNAGKSGKKIEQHAPTEADRLRLSQERNEQLRAYEAAREASRAREELGQMLVNYWCDLTGNESMHRPTYNVVFRYLQDFGWETVIPWIDRAAQVCYGNDTKMGKYVSGCRRQHLAYLAEDE